MVSCEQSTKAPTERGQDAGEAARRERAKPKQPQTTKAKTRKAIEEGKNNTSQRPTQTCNTIEHPQGRTQTKRHPIYKDKQSSKTNHSRRTQAPTTQKKTTQKENLAGGSASCLVFLVCVLVVMICLISPQNQDRLRLIQHWWWKFQMLICNPYNYIKLYGVPL